jgi:hypothetical protein
MRSFLFGASCFWVLVGGPAGSADPPAGKEKLRPLAGKELSGTWQGEQEGVKVRITFRGAADATWVVNTRGPVVQNGRVLGDWYANIAADLKRVDNRKAGVVDLRLDFVIGATGERRSELVGRLERGESGGLRITILPAATKVTAEYQPVEGLPLQEVKGKKPE